MAEDRVFSSSANADTVYSAIYDALSSSFDSVNTDNARRIACFQRQFVFPGQWTDITNLEITIEVDDSGRGSTVHFHSSTRTNNLMNNTPWQVSSFVGDCAAAVENVAHGAMANY